MTVDADALSQVLSAVDLRIGTARRERLAAGGLLPLARAGATLIYVAEGELSTHERLGLACRLNSAGAAFEPTGADAVRLSAGDAFLSFGRSEVALEAVDTAKVVIVDLELSDAAVRLTHDIPSTLAVYDFDAADPAAAALAAHMGIDDPAVCQKRTGDLLVCRMMATTVLLAVIRAWAMSDQAAAWPSRQGDPFLDRVIAAIHDEPGREWTVARLASVGAMSRSTFAERFRSAIGRSPAEYVTEVRIDAAKRMLHAGRSVSATSRDLGYGSDEGFRRAFRRRTGMSPSAWRTTADDLVPVRRDEQVPVGLPA